MKFPKWLKWLDLHFEETIMVILLAALSCVMMLQVIARYVTGHALPWPEEFCRYCFVWSVMLATSFCIRTNRMLKVDMVTTLLPEKVQKVLDLMAKLLCLAFCCIMFMPSVRAVAATKIGAKWQTSPAMLIPMKFIYASAPVGFGLGIIRSIQSLVFAVRDFNKPMNAPAEKAEEKEEKA
ncbi:MAG: TRAP transporter small permease [Oscillospiraceae bacterium]|nr:TRAP transporter small permease [Oscillospiraceae bacterium]